MPQDEESKCREGTCQLLLLRKQLKESLLRIASLERENRKLRRDLDAERTAELIGAIIFASLFTAMIVWVISCLF